MSLQLYNRIASVEIGPPGQNGRRFAGLRISFNVKKPNPGLKNSANTALVEIYNLSEDSRNQIKEVEHVLVLKAGYTEASGEEVVFIGNITTLSHIKNPPNVITRIECGDGNKNLREMVTSLSYKAGTELSQVLSDVGIKFNLTKKQIVESLQLKGKTFTQGFSFTGPVKKLLDKLGDAGNFDWSIQNDVLKFVSKDGADFTRAVKITPKTGMLESPVRVNDILGKMDKKASLKGWQIQSLLQPKLEPGGIIIVESQEIPADSKFKIIDVEHVGDTHDNPWFSNVKAIDL